MVADGCLVFYIGELMIKEKVYNLIILFGLAGSGKNYVGEILQKHFNYYFWDGDTLLTKEMHGWNTKIITNPDAGQQYLTF